jgi:membrane fusion protein (multidrug efflux system)
LYQSHTITKQQYEQAFSGKARSRKSSACFTAAKATAFQKSVIVAKSKASDKQTDVAAANIKRAKIA